MTPQPDTQDPIGPVVSSTSDATVRDAKHADEASMSVKGRPPLSYSDAERVRGRMVVIWRSVTPLA